MNNDKTTQNSGQEEQWEVCDKLHHDCAACPYEGRCENEMAYFEALNEEREKHSRWF